MTRPAAATRDYWWRREGMPQSLAHIIPENAARTPMAVVMERRKNKRWVPITAAGLATEVAQLALGLIDAGIQPGDRVALMADTRYEWTITDAAIWACGGVTVPIYPSSSADQLRWILEDSGAVGCVFERPEFRALLTDEHRESLPALQHEWLIDGGRHADTLDAVIDAGRGRSTEELARRRSALTADSLATVIYTSGTTGRPKGCELTHGNFLAEVGAAMDGLEEVFSDPNASTLLFLPLAHVFGRMIQVAVLLGAIRTGHTDIGRVSTDLSTFRPTFVLAVPRVFERILDGAARKARASGNERIFVAAVNTAIAYSQAKEKGGASVLLRARHRVFERLVYRELRAALGGQLRWGISGGAGLGERLGHAFSGFGLPVLEGYGLTETTAAAVVNAPSDLRIGSVGRPLPGFEATIGEGGEILLRGPHVFRGYWQNPEATQATMTEHGWLRTGDLGRIDGDGYLHITGRVKDILVTSTGKNVSPGPLEAALAAHPLISQAVVVGDGQPQIAALLTLDREALIGWMREQGRPFIDPVTYMHDEALLEALQGAVDGVNETVSSAEWIVRFRVLPIEFSVEAGQLTPTLKVRRAAVMEEFAADVAALYPKKASTLA